MLIGIDFDNTIACYDEGFLCVAHEMELVPANFHGGKKAVRDAVRNGAGGDIAWQMLQARLYGRDIGRARLTDGVTMLLERARLRNIPVVVISHKTQFSPFDAATDLLLAAKAWMEANGLFDPAGMGVRPENVFFEATRQDKLRRIASLGCTHFIDDLDEVFHEPDFPDGVRSYLYAAGYDEIPSGQFWAFRTHREIADHLLGVDPREAAMALLGGSVQTITPLARGGNNRLYRVTGAEGTVALKSYPRPDDDSRDRIGAEYGALSFLRAQGEPAVPAPIAMRRDIHAALYQWIDGTVISAPNGADIDMALAFLARVHGYRKASDAAALPLASEACLSTAEIMRQLDVRAERLAEPASNESALGQFLERWREVRERFAAKCPDEELPRSRQTLSPSDFGFHNALRMADGQVVFVDFEYFGWDDPVKLAADFLLHPGMTLDRECRRQFAGGMIALHAGDGDFRARLIRQLPLYALRWCLILLNEFLPERWARRVVAGEGNSDHARSRQLQKAKAMLNRVKTASEDLR